MNPAITGRPQGMPPAVSLRFDTDIVESIDRMQVIVSDPVNSGKTFQVSEKVFRHFIKRLNIEPCRPEEIASHQPPDRNRVSAR